MVRVCFHQIEGVRLAWEEITHGNDLAPDKLARVIWVDLLSATQSERQHVEELFEVEFLSRQETEEIEQSSRYMEYEDEIYANSNFITPQSGSYANEPVSFILKLGVLFTTRSAELRTFFEVERRLEIFPRQYPNGFAVLVDLFEARIDADADLIENIARQVTLIGKTLSITEQTNTELLLSIASFQETTMMLRENVIDKQRVVSSMLKSAQFPRETNEKLRIIIKDINSVLEHTNFSFERLEYLQNTFLGLINIEQNKIIKIFTVVSVVFMPPTLIASIYGMNFDVMPELHWTLGYPFSLLLMVAASGITLFVFKKNRWL